MSLTQAVFILLGAMAVLGALGMVTLRNLFHSALAMILALFSIAGVYVLLEAEFLAVVQVLVYVGAIAMLILFGIMLTRDIVGRATPVRNRQWPLALAVSAGLLAVLAVGLVRAVWTQAAGAAPAGVADLGLALVGPYALPFEVASVLLLVAMVGALIIAREARE
jgi:NADH-quinone oxidoreductase subunit J